MPQRIPSVIRLFAALLSCGLASGMLAASEAGSDARPAPESPPMNILFIMADDHGWQAISAYGSILDRTPQIDRIARAGARLDRFFVGNSICAPARATILTGLHSHAHGVMTNGNMFDAGQRTAPAMLRDAGYTTALVGKWHLKNEPQGFDYYDRLLGQGPYYNPVMRRLQADGSTADVRNEGYTTDVITDKAVEWLQNRPTDRPFALYVQHKAPHREWSPPLRHLELFADREMPAPPTLFDDWSGKGTAATQQEMTIARDFYPLDVKLRSPPRLTAEQQAAWDAAYGPRNEAMAAQQLSGDDLTRWRYQRYVKDYLRTVRAVDEGVGRLLDELERQGLADNTLVIYTSDQGWYLGEHGWYDKRWMYEESFRAPCLVRWPGVTRPGSSIDALTQNIDIAPTMLAAAGLEPPSDMHGVSLRPVLDGTPPFDWRRSVFYQYYEFPSVHMVHRHFGVRTERYKLMYFYLLDEWEFYDLERDPDEVDNRIDDPAYADIISELSDELARLRERYDVPDDTRPWKRD